jgi:glycosyltransferase involved in cell wall biosynthesis
MSNLSVIIPARNEQFLAHTIQDILAHSEADTEIIAVLDGQWASLAYP